MRERIPKSVKYIFSFKIPQRLELKPFGNIVFKLLDFSFNQPEGFLESVIRKLGELMVPV